jgi:copper transport protein
MGIFSLALWNRFSLTPCIRAGDHRAASILVTSIKIELALAVAVFAVVAAWRFTPPPRAFAAAAPALVHARTDRAAADVEFRPGRAGSVRVAIRPLRTDRAPLEVREVVLLMSNPDAGIEPIRRPAGRAEAGVWMIDGLTIPVAGRWQVQVDLLVSDFEQITLSAPVAIRP